jgi:hypothetical protein
MREWLFDLGGSDDNSPILTFSQVSKKTLVSKLFSLHSSPSVAAGRSRSHGMHLPIKYLAGIWFVDTTKYQGSLFLKDSQIFKDSNCLG